MISTVLPQVAFFAAVVDLRGDNRAVADQLVEFGLELVERFCVSQTTWVSVISSRSSLFLPSISAAFVFLPEVRAVPACIAWVASRRTLMKQYTAPQQEPCM